jgi:hypothetical protein
MNVRTPTSPDSAFPVSSLLLWDCPAASSCRGHIRDAFLASLRGRVPSLGLSPFSR